MQHIKGTEKIGVLKEVAHTGLALTDSLAKVIDIFEMEKYFTLFNIFKTKGFAIGDLLKVSVIMPFVGVANVYALLKHGFTGPIQAKKDAYYTAKNNEHIDWRKILYKTAKRFKHLVNKDITLNYKRVTALIFDDTLLEKTGKGIEKISLTFDHVTKRYVLGYKLLLCGFWDGVSFIPLDFTIHREKGSRQDEINKQYHRTTKILGETKVELKKAKQQLCLCQKNLLLSEAKFANNPNILKNIIYNRDVKVLHQKAEASVQAIENKLVFDTKAQAAAK